MDTRSVFLQQSYFLIFSKQEWIIKICFAFRYSSNRTQEYWNNMYGLTPLSEQGSGASFLAEIQVEYVQVDPFIRAGFWSFIPS